MMTVVAHTLKLWTLGSDRWLVRGRAMFIYVNIYSIRRRLGVDCCFLLVVCCYDTEHIRYLSSNGDS